MLMVGMGLIFLNMGAGRLSPCLENILKKLAVYF
jgi:hypothetical protein